MTDREIEQKIRGSSRNVPAACGLCGFRLEYIGIGEYRCLKCGNHMLDDYGKVRKYIIEFGKSGIIEIANGTGVSKDYIEQLIEEGTLVFEGDDSGIRKCVKCGKRIERGRYCRDCMKQTLTGLQDAFSMGISEKNDDKDQATARMRFFRN